MFGAPEILRTASREISSRGFACFLPCDPYEKTVSPLGALALACGAKEKDLSGWDGNLELSPVPDNKWAYFMETLTFVESIIDMDIDEWSETADLKMSVELFRKAANRIDIAVI
jgi:hypothetical protein